MITLKKLRTIAIAKFSDKSNLGDWYEKRLEICSQCPFNSKNKEHLSVKEKAMVAFNAGEPTCLACGCEIAAKASVRDESCGLSKVQQVPLWRALPEIEIGEFSDFKVENLSSDMVSMEIKDKIVLDYGTLRRGAPSTIQISIKDKKNLITRFNASSSCSCTVPTPRKKGDTYFVSIKYNTDLVGRINKDITFRITREGKTLNFKANITGTVIN